MTAATAARQITANETRRAALAAELPTLGRFADRRRAVVLGTIKLIDENLTILRRIAAR